MLAAQRKQEQPLGHGLASPTTPSMVLQESKAYPLPCMNLQVTLHLSGMAANIRPQALSISLYGKADDE